MRENVFIAEVEGGIAWAMFAGNGMYGTEWDFVLEDAETGELEGIGHVSRKHNGMWEYYDGETFRLTDDACYVLEFLVGGIEW